MPAHRGSVLIVDDQRVVLHVFAQALEKAGFSVRVADRAGVALEAVRTERPDAILLDMTMPYVNGLGFLYRLRETAPDIPVAIVTGNAVTQETQEELDDLGVAVYFKPLTAPQLEGVVDTLLKSASGGVP
jgi:two-component system, OmpR family, response regulator MprA